MVLETQSCICGILHFETERLILRNYENEDGEAYYKFGRRIHNIGKASWNGRTKENIKNHT